MDMKDYQQAAITTAKPSTCNIADGMAKGFIGMPEDENVLAAWAC